jgi:hypothetical protein
MRILSKIQILMRNIEATLARFIVSIVVLRHMSSSIVAVERKTQQRAKTAFCFLF